MAELIAAAQSQHLLSREPPNTSTSRLCRALFQAKECACVCVGFDEKRSPRHPLCLSP